MHDEASPINGLTNQSQSLMDTITLGAGCFWCIEAIFEGVEGVESTVSGYMGGSIKNPSYREVCTGNTGHAEVVQVVYNPYILDSVGWAYYLVGDLIKAEQFLRKAIKIMPNDPIVNDHYGDILWAMNRKTQAKYYWQSVLNFENTEDDMKEKINIKLLKGPKKI
jgi:tetratricopeptide (TPR) repeat protein